MRAGYIEKPMAAVFRDNIPEPQITQADQVKIKVVVSGICGSEVHAYHGRHKWRVPPLVSGHEFAGVIVELGAAVTRYRIGDRVTAEPQYGCGHCALCRAGHYNLCPEKKILGASYWSGSFGEYIVVPERCVIPLSESVTFEEGALIEPLAVGMHSVRRHKVGESTSIAVIGCGTIGLGIILSAKALRARQIIAIDVMDFNLEKAESMGADLTLNSLRDDVLSEVMTRTDGRGVDITFLAFGSAGCVKQAAEITAPGGTVSDIAVMDNGIPAPLNDIQVKELNICGSNMYTSDDFHTVMRGIGAGDISLDGFVTHRFPIEDIHEAMEYADKHPQPVIKILLSF